jgi:Zn-finger nucleic acid-binding protein
MADNKELLTCPACGNEMKKIYLEGKSINIDICLDGCGGILFDNRELEKFDDEHENIDEILNSITGKTFAEVDTKKALDCPVCGNVMLKMGADDGKVEIDCCGLCGAKFLNNGELQAIRTKEESAIDPKVHECIDVVLEQVLDYYDSKSPNWKTTKAYKGFKNVIQKMVYNQTN